MSRVDNLNSQSSSLLASLDDSSDDAAAQFLEDDPVAVEDTRQDTTNSYGWENVQHLLEDKRGGRRRYEQNAQLRFPVQQQRQRSRAYTRKDSDSSGSLPNNDLMAIPSMIAPPSFGRSEGKRFKSHRKYDHPVARQRNHSFKRKDSESSDEFLDERPTKSLRENDIMAIPSIIAPPKPSPRGRFDIPQQRPVPKPSPLPKHPGRRARSFASPRDRRMSAGKYARNQRQTISVAASPRNNIHQGQQKMNFSSIDTMASAESSREELQPRIASPRHLPHVGTPDKAPYTTSMGLNNERLRYNAAEDDSSEGLGDYQSEMFPPLSPDKSLFSQASEASGSPPKTLFSYWLSPPSNKNRRYSTSDEDDSTFDGLSTLYSSMVPSDLGSPGRHIQTMHTDDLEFHPRQFSDPITSPDKILSQSVGLVSRCPESPMTPHDQLLYGHLHNVYSERNYTPSKTTEYDNNFSNVANTSTTVRDEIERESVFESPALLQDTQSTHDVEIKKKPIVIKKTKLKSASSRQYPRKKWDFNDLDPDSSDSAENSSTINRRSSSESSAKPEKRRWKFEELLESNDDVDNASGISPSTEVNADSLWISPVECDQKESVTSITPGKRKWKFEELLASANGELSSRVSDNDELDDDPILSEADESVRTEDIIQQENDDGKRKWKFEELLVSNDDDDNDGASPFIELNDDNSVQQELTAADSKMNLLENINDSTTPSKKKWRFEELLASNDDESSYFVGADNSQSDSDDSILNIVLDRQNSADKSGRRRWKFEDLLDSNDNDIDSGLSSSDHVCDEVEYVQSQLVVKTAELHEVITIFQSRVRGALVRQSYRRCQDAATVIQRCFRSYNSNKARHWEEAMVEGLMGLPVTDENRIKNYLMTYDAKVQLNLQQRQNYLDYHSSIIDMLSSRISDIKKLRRCEQYHRFLSSVVHMQANIRARQTRKPLTSLENEGFQPTERVGTDDLVSDQIKRYAQAHASLVLMQALVRGSLCRKRVNDLHSVTIQLQNFTRAMLQRRRYRRVLSGFVVFQATVRGVLERKSSVIIKSVVLVQSHLRSFHARSRYLKVKAGIILVQKLLRRLQAVKRLKRYHCYATLIQTVARQFNTRRRYAKIKRGVTFFQALVRGHLARNITAVTTSALMKIQCRMRSLLQMNKYNQLRKAVVSLQSNIRAVGQKRKFQAIIAATICIQSFVRGSLMRKQFKAASLQAAIIQKGWAEYRQITQSQITKSSYSEDLKQTYLAAIKIQSAIRMHQCWLELQRKKEEYRMVSARKEATAATQIQSVVRMRMSRRLFSQMAEKEDSVKKCTAAVVIQSYVRLVLCQRELASLRQAAAIANHANRIEAAVVIQSFGRSLACKRMLKDMKRRQREDIMVRMTAAATIQSQVRSLQCKRELARRRLYANKMQKAAMKLQSCWRSWACRRELEMAARQATKIQRCYNRFRIATRIKSAARTKLVYAEDLKKAYLAAIKIQSAIRMHQCWLELQRKKEEYRTVSARKEATAATQIQSVVRMRMSRHMFSQMAEKEDSVKKRAAAVAIQAYARSTLCRRELAPLRQAAATANHANRIEAAVVIQSFGRSLVCKRMLKDMKMRQRDDIMVRMTAAITIQSQIRSLQCKSELARRRSYANEMQKAAMKLQSCWRSWACRRELAMAARQATTIQRCYNRFRTATRIKSAERTRLVYAEDLKQTYLAAIKIQSAIRMHQCWLELQRKKEEYRTVSARKEATAATQIQSVVRMRMSRHMFSQMAEKEDSVKKREAAVVIQACARSILCRRELASLREVVIHSDHDSCSFDSISMSSFTELVHLVRLQALVRGKLARMKYRKAFNSAVCIQKQWRYNSSNSEVVSYSSYFKYVSMVQKRFKEHYCLRDSAAKKIQLAYLSRRMKRNLTKVHRSVKLIQRAVRGHRARCMAQRMRAIRYQTAATKIQSIARVHRCLSDLQLANLNARKIQTCYRRYNVTFLENSIQEEKKKYILTLKRRNHEAMAIRIQSAIRSWLYRARTSKADFTVVGTDPSKSATTNKLPAPLYTNDASARVIQSQWRSFRCCNEFLLRRDATVVIQSFVRSWLCRRTKLIKLRLKAVEAQVHAREVAAITLQTFTRSLNCRKKFSLPKAEAHVVDMQRRETRLMAARKIQSIVRAHISRRDIQFAHTNAAKIQKLYRVYMSNTFAKAHSDEKKAYLTMLERCHKNAMATRIQAVARSWLSKRKMRTADLSATIIQAKWRSHRCQSLMLVKRTILKRRQSAILAAAVLLQSIIRSWLCRRKLNTRTAAVVTIQSYARSYNAHMLQSRLVAERLSMTSKAAVVIQSIIRMYLFKSRLDAANEAAFIIQQAWSRFVSSLREKILVVSELLEVSRYSSRYHLPTPMHKARTLLPRDLKGLNRIRSITPHLPRRYECGVFIQEVMNSVAMVIQSFVRRYLALLHIKQLHNAASSIQKAWRTTSRWKKLRVAVLSIQSVARGWLVRRNASILLTSTITLQLFYRNTIAQRASRAEHESMVAEEAEENAAIMIQKLFRIRLAKILAIKLRHSKRDHHCTLRTILDGDDDLKRLSEYFASLRFSSKQFEEVAEMQWGEEKTRLAEEIRLETEKAKENKRRSGTVRMSTDAEMDSIMKAIYRRAEAAFGETDPTTTDQCVMTHVTKLSHALATANEIMDHTTSE